jgi:hypothetical protein
MSYSILKAFRISLWIIPVLLLPPCVVKGQGEFKNAIGLAVLKIADPLSPGIELNYERSVNPELSFRISGTYLADILGICRFSQLKGYRFTAEQKYHFFRPEDKSWYYSAEFAILSSTYSDKARFGYERPWIDTLGLTYNYTDTFTVRKVTLALNLRMGYQIRIDNMLIDISMGLGLKYKNIIHDERINPNDEMERSRNFNLYYLSNREGRYLTVNVPINFTLAYRF